MKLTDITSRPAHTRGSVLVQSPRGIVTASASVVDADPDSDIPFLHWYVNRVLVQEGYRGQGYGSAAVQQLLKAIEKSNQAFEDIPVIVTPGGYNSSPQRLHTFYTRLGFTLWKPRCPILIWRAHEPTQHLSCGT